MATPEKTPKYSEITPEQQEILISRMRELMGPTLPASAAVTDEEARQLDIDESTHSEMSHVMDLISEAWFKLDDKKIYINEWESIGLPHHDIELTEISPPERIDNRFYKIAEKTYKIDLIAKEASFQEKNRVYRSQIMELLKPVIPKPLETDWSDEEISGMVENILSLHETETALGVNIFTQERFGEAMAILDQLGEHNRISND